MSLPPLTTVLWVLAFSLGAQGGTPPALSGHYRGELGTLQLETEEGRVNGLYEAGGACEFNVGRRVLEGQLVGNVLVGSVTLCLVGAECKERSLPVAAFYSAADRSLTAQVKLPPGCSSPALREGRLTLVP